MSANLFDITDNKYVEISNVKLSGVVEDHFIRLRGNKFHEVDGVHYQPFDNLSMFHQNYQDHLKENTRESNVIVVDNGGSNIVYTGFDPIDGIIHYEKEKSLMAPKKVRGMDVAAPYLSGRLSYYLNTPDLSGVTRNSDIIDYLSSSDFILPQTDPALMTSAHIDKSSDSNNYGYGSQCYLNAGISECENEIGRAHV